MRVQSVKNNQQAFCQNIMRTGVEVKNWFPEVVPLLNKMTQSTELQNLWGGNNRIWFRLVPEFPGELDVISTGSDPIGFFSVPAPVSFAKEVEVVMEKTPRTLVGKAKSFLGLSNCSSAIATKPTHKGIIKAIYKAAKGLN